MYASQLLNLPLTPSVPKAINSLPHLLTASQETGQYFNFSNIRYGVAPLGNLRFSAPLPPRGRNRTVNDGQTSVICPQANPGWELITGQFLAGANITSLENETTFSLSNIPPPVPGSSEDCLFLDVMVPEKIFNSQRAKKKRGEIARCSDCDEHSNGSEYHLS